jgi:hypothetical protein
MADNLIHIFDTLLSDFHKDAFGFRPTHYQVWWTEEELQAEYDRLDEICQVNMAEEKIRNDAEQVRFEELIQETINHGAGDRKTALRWLIQGEGLNIEYRQDVEHFFWMQGIGWENSDTYKSEIAEFSC